MQIPNVLPEQTEFMSKAKACGTPRPVCALAAVAGCMQSGDEVESTRPCTFSGGKFAFLRHARPASIAKSLVHESSGAIRLERTPVLEAMRGLDAAGNWVNCSFRTTFSGK
jgi:hypothetical protein